MEIIKVNSTSVKVILNREECEGYEFISGDEASEDAVLLSIDSLLDKINKAESLDLKNDKLLLQVYPSKSGGCEVYISRTEEKRLYKEKTPLEGVKRNASYINIYRFDTLEGLISACFRLNLITEDEESQVYYDSVKEKYYLICQGVSVKEMRFAFLCEYAKVQKPQTLHYIKEHLKCICQSNAISSLSNLM